MNAKLMKLNGIDTIEKIASKKKELAKYDYIGVKIATGCATKEEYATQIEYCESLRAEIRELEKQL